MGKTSFLATNNNFAAIVMRGEVKDIWALKKWTRKDE